MKRKIKDFVINPYLVSRRISDYDIQYYPDDSEAFVFQGKKYNLE